MCLQKGPDLLAMRYDNLLTYFYFILCTTWVPQYCVILTTEYRSYSMRYSITTPINKHRWNKAIFFPGSGRARQFRRSICILFAIVVPVLPKLSFRNAPSNFASVPSCFWTIPCSIYRCVRSIRRHRGFPSRYKSNKGKHRFSAPSKQGGAGAQQDGVAGVRSPDLPQALSPRPRSSAACGTHRRDAPPKIQNLDKWKRNCCPFRAPGCGVVRPCRTSVSEM